MDMRHESYNQKSLEESLAKWKVELSPDPCLKHKVLRHIAIAESSESDGPLSRIPLLRWIASRPLAAAAMTCTALMLISVSSFVWEEHRMEEHLHAQTQSYFLFIDPPAHIAAASTAGHEFAQEENPSLIDMLAWMRSSLDLSRDQFMALVELHSKYEDRFMAIYKDLSEIQTEYQAFENKRMNNDMIDFMQLYDLLRERDTLRASSEQTSRELVSLVLRVLTPEQAKSYMALLNVNGLRPLYTPKTSPNNAGA